MTDKPEPRVLRMVFTDDNGQDYVQETELTPEQAAKLAAGFEAGVTGVPLLNYITDSIDEPVGMDEQGRPVQRDSTTD